MKTKRQKQTAVIRVTQKDIDAGEQNNPEACPVFLALDRTLELTDEYNSWNADYDDIDLDDKIKTPARVRNWMKKFDDDKTSVKPFSFRLFFNGWATPKVK